MMSGNGSTQLAKYNPDSVNRLQASLRARAIVNRKRVLGSRGLDSALSPAGFRASVVPRGDAFASFGIRREVRQARAGDP
jgi:hypothetical protein